MLGRREPSGARTQGGQYRVILARPRTQRCERSQPQLRQQSPAEAAVRPGVRELSINHLGRHFDTVSAMDARDPIDGRFGEAWSGTVPDGSHVNVVIARRGSPTAAAAASAFATPGPGHAPVMACLGAGNAVRPATIVLN